ncbi:MAG: hypothetical protein WC894_00615 [Patescibacteria group bacterium]
MRINFKRKNCAIEGCEAKKPSLRFLVRARAWGEQIFTHQIINPPKGNGLLTPEVSFENSVIIGVNSCGVKIHDNAIQKFLKDKGFLHIEQEPIMEGHLRKS